ncbi:MAG TPA: M28 family peptidase, partial [Thermomicrobiales bacterium]|nr:M28 family peptidase [Thermomicrobiales bacterium]
MSVKPSTQDVLAVANACIEPIVELTTRLTEIPAPTNDEGQRAAAVRQEMERLGFSRVTEDELHDIVGVIPGKDSSKCLLLAAHIDTVFPRHVDLTVTRDGDVLRGPGIGDNTLSVASALMLI